MKKLLVVLLSLLSLLPTLAMADGIPIKDQNSATMVEVNANNALEVVQGKPTRATYNITATGLPASAAYNLVIESGAATGMKIYGICVGMSNATATTWVTVNVNRRTAASTGGTVCGSEISTSCNVAKFDPADAAWPGAAPRVTATLGVIGALVDGWSFMVGELGAGAADPPGNNPFCKQYGENGTKPIIVSLGTTNGLSVTVTAIGAGALAAGSISMLAVAE